MTNRAQRAAPSLAAAHMIAAVTALGAAGSAQAVEIELSNPDYKLRADVTARYNRLYAVLCGT